MFTLEHTSINQFQNSITTLPRPCHTCKMDFFYKNKLTLFTFFAEKSHISDV